MNLTGKDLARAIPWITELKAPTDRCEGFIWHKATAPEVQEYLEGRLPDRVRCKYRGWWQYEAWRNTDGRSGIYCWHHLKAQAARHGESERFERWRKRNP